MNRRIVLVAASVLAMSVAGCSTVKRATGQLDDSVLPGQRENVLPPDQQTARDPNVAGGRAAPQPDVAAQCAPDEPNCVGNPPAQDTSTYTDPSIAEQTPAEPPPKVKKPAPKKVAAKKKPVKKKKPIVKKPIVKKSVVAPTEPAVTSPDDSVPPPPAPSDQPPKL